MPSHSTVQRSVTDSGRDATALEGACAASAVRGAGATHSFHRPEYCGGHFVTHYVARELRRPVAARGPAQARALHAVVGFLTNPFERYVIASIDAATGERDTMGAVLERSVRTAQALRAAGVRVGDVVVSTGRNHIDIVIPLYASLFLGASFMGIDYLLKKDQVERLLDKVKGKFIFCDVANLDLLPDSLPESYVEVLTFQNDPDVSYRSFKEFYQSSDIEESIDDFQSVTLCADAAHVESNFSLRHSEEYVVLWYLESGDRAGLRIRQPTAAGDGQLRGRKRRSPRHVIRRGALYR
ncbi:hypothetical protein EVAR_103372_1 [Eumeta japonica]|uniref:AMP-dependent synthetase/ligase domain-containing protein n=1 Tax=Eumeta variegata TaxID=151549 RepID=A0A4C1Y6G4_EUMVA|nr:hypothetical protein EVAR_103372_1 [Eumeta japonica]